ncbi:MAG: energy transducer TonB [Pyrinomonadaceae bacterium]|nr:energy transducer TonB [Pyrinomonadaceae bacterium]
MYACFLKRFLPFVVALKIGLLLVMLASAFDLPWRRARSSAAPPQAHSRTWLIINSVPAPNYTEQEAREKGATDTLRLRALLDRDGIVSAVELMSEATEEFAADAMRAASRIKFRPATEDGRPVSLWVMVDYTCSGYHSAHRYQFKCAASIAGVEQDWRVIHE